MLLMLKWLLYFLRWVIVFTSSLLYDKVIFNNLFYNFLNKKLLNILKSISCVSGYISPG